jgi:hypothetical protein
LIVFISENLVAFYKYSEPPLKAMLCLNYESWILKILVVMNMIPLMQLSQIFDSKTTLLN